MTKIDEVLGNARVIPIVAVENIADAVPLAEALVAGGLFVIEVLLRTDATLSAVEQIARYVPEARVGLGTVIEPWQFSLAANAGAQFIVSPSCRPALIEAALTQPLPWVPTIGTANEVDLLRSMGFELQKLFPADVLTMNFAIQIQGPYPTVNFCPTGTIDQINAREWLRLPNIRCVGGIWPAPPELIRANDWTSITALAREAAALGDL